MSNNKETTILDVLRPSLYLFDELHPLYIKIASEEQKVYFSVFGKKKKANAVKEAFERAVGLAAEPMAEIAIKALHATKDAPKYYAESMLQLYRLYIEMVESRIIVLKMFIQNGLTDELKLTNKKMLDKCTKYDKLYKVMNEQTTLHSQMFQMMGPFKNIYEFLDTMNIE